MKIFLLNFSHEMAMADGHVNYYPPPHVRQLEHDLEPLAYWLASPEDVVLVEKNMKIICEDYYSRYCKNVAFKSLPFKVSGQAEICPWGWNSQIAWRLCKNGNFQLPHDDFLENIRSHASRRYAVELLDGIRCCFGPSDELCGSARFCKEVGEIEDALSSCFHSILKAPWSSSGRGIRFGEERLGPPLSGWCARLIAKQGGVVVEPWMKRVEDLAAEYYVQASGEVTYMGLSSFVTTSRCSYVGNWVADQDVLSRRLFSLFDKKVYESVVEIQRSLLYQMFGHWYVGPLGIDMMLCQDGDKVKLHPCVEINVRHTMGHLALALAGMVSPGHLAMMNIHYSPDSRRLAENVHQFPIAQFDENGRLQEGTMLLTPLVSDTCYVATLSCYNDASL